MSRVLLTIRFMIFIVLLGFPSLLSSADWVYIGVSKTKPIYRYYIDCDSLIIEGNQITYWVKEKNIDIGEIQTRKTIDCKDFVSRNSDVVVYRSDGSLSKSDSLGDRAEWSGIAPETMMNIQRLLLCHENNYPRKELKEHLKGYESILLRDKKNP